MADRNSSFSFSFGGFSLQISGSDLFVDQQVEPYRELIAQKLRSASASIDTVETSVDPEVEQAVEAGQGAESYPNAIAINGDKVSIICKVPGGNTAEKAGNLCLMYIWAKKTLLGQDEVSASELRELCKEHAVYDSGNFAAHLKNRRSHFLPTGAKGSNSKSYKITFPGQSAARALLDATTEAS